MKRMKHILKFSLYFLINQLRKLSEYKRVNLMRDFMICQNLIDQQKVMLKINQKKDLNQILDNIEDDY